MGVSVMLSWVKLSSCSTILEIIDDDVFDRIHDKIGHCREPSSSERGCPQGGSSSFQTHPNSSSFFNIGTPTNWQTSMQSQPGQSNWHSQMPTQSATPYWQPAFPSHPESGNAFADENVRGDDVVFLEWPIICSSKLWQQLVYTFVPDSDFDSAALNGLVVWRVPHSYDEIKAMVEKQIQEDRVSQLAMMNLAHQFNDASIAKDELRKVYEECRDIPLEQRAVIKIFWKIESDLGLEYGTENCMEGVGEKLGVDEVLGEKLEVVEALGELIS
ncbi:hypothetical protein Tco_1531616 [Tanacetum coccineum]